MGAVSFKVHLGSGHHIPNIEIMFDYDKMLKTYMTKISDFDELVHGAEMSGLAAVKKITYIRYLG